MNDQRPEWIAMAADEITNGEGLSALTAYTSVVAIGIIADIIARHAPAQDQAIGPGDVVQTPVGDTYIVAGLRPDNHVNVWFNRTLVHVSIEHVTRVGRAKYWPDGSPVESDK